MKEKWPHLKAIPFEDVSRRRQIDVLIGSDHPVFHRIHREIHGSNVNDPVARLTNLGWVCFGPTSPPSSGHSRIHSTRTYRTSTPFQEHKNQTTNDLLRRFWELDVLGMNDHPTCPRPTADEQAAIDQAERTLSFKNGRYEIGVLWKRNEPKFSNNYELGLPRLKNLEKSLQRKDPKIIEDYSIKGYVRRTTQKDENQWLLPHFPVVREDKSTTKVRVVFDAATKYEGRCLNDAILPGPKLQLEIVDVLLRFRRAPVAISADIAEMFLQVRLREEDQAFHRFLWRDLDASREPDVYKFLRLPFGNSSSPFCAQYVLQSHSKSNAAEYPQAAKTIENSMYVDDVLDSRETVEEARELQKQLSTVLKNGGFDLRKWSSNQPSALADIPAAERLSNIKIQDPNNLSHKTLGVLWKTTDDVFTFHLENLKNNEKATKRNVRRVIASLFDPLQFLAPYTTRAKMLMQEIWQAGVEWDEVLPVHLHAKWTQWVSELAELSYVQIPHCLRQTNPTSIYLHVFSDSSEKAYATVTYLVCHYGTDGAVTSCIIMAKSRVSPIKAVTIPRLELMGAVLSTRIATSILRVVTNVVKTTYWTDSTNVLHWIRSESRTFKQFVANRVGEIHRATDPDQWRHVPGEFNPADLPTRGIPASELTKSKLWIEGPDFLKTDESTWPEKLLGGIENPDEVNERRVNVHASSNKDRITHEGFLKPTSFSSLRRLIRVTAWVQRFLDNCRLDRKDRTLGDTLDPDALTKADNWWLRKAETETFPMGEEQQSLTRLNPKKDKDSLLRALP